MSNIPVSGPRSLQSARLPAAAQGGGRAAGLQTASASGKLAARLPMVESVTQLADTVSISEQGLAARAADLGSATTDYAQAFISSFVRQLFGDDAKGATLSFDSATLAANASFSASAEMASGPEGSASSASFSLSESASFIGKGQIVTADGQRFEFEIEVNYEASVRASATQASARDAQVEVPDSAALVGKQLPDIEFPGSLADLFKLLGRELQTSGPHNPDRPDKGVDGKLSLRLLRLVNSAALLAPRAQPDAADRSRALANVYAG
jgi:hypothetical protein